MTDTNIITWAVVKFWALSVYAMTTYFIATLLASLFSYYLKRIQYIMNAAIAKAVWVVHNPDYCVCDLYFFCLVLLNCPFFPPLILTCHLGQRFQ